MIDRTHSRARGGRLALGVARTLALCLGTTVVAGAAETPPNVQTPPPAPDPKPAAASAAPASAPALPPPTQAQPANDDEDETEAPKAPAPDASASHATPEPNPAPSALIVLPVPQQPPAPEQPDPNTVDDGKMGSHQEHWLLGVGLRETFVTSKGYDPFSTDNVLPQVSLDLGRAFYASGPLSIAALIAWDYGSTKATARGADASLAVHRLTAGAEARYHFLRRLYVFGRVAPGALRSDATLHDQVVGLDRQTGAWVFASDFSLGSAFEFAGDPRGASTRPRGWIGVDGGYSWAGSSKLDFKTKSSDPSTPARLEPLSFGDLAVRGAFLRLTATLTY